MTEMASQKRITAAAAETARRLDDCRELLALTGDADQASIDELDRDSAKAEFAIKALAVETYLTGPHDHDATVFFKIQAGAGGVDSCDWAEMMLRMYTRWFERHGYTHTALDVSVGEEAGIHYVSLRVTGPSAYGYLRGEIGNHRLVRISPFDSNQRRHTSFAAVDVLPEIKEAPIDVAEKDLLIETYRAGGKGGQHVNKTESAVRITHVPTGLVAACQNERSQHQNRQMAMQYLRSKLTLMRETELNKEVAAHRDAKAEISFGSRIRSYYLQPEQMVRDERTGIKTSAVEAVLDGDLDEFIEGYLQMQAKKK
jgi:peptide chain release factor 2